MILIDQTKEQIGVMLHPSEKINGRSISASMAYYYKVAIIPLILTVILSLVFHSNYLSSISPKLAGLGLVLIIILFVLLVPLGILINAGILHIIGKLFNVFKGSYADSVAAVTYASCTFTVAYWLTSIPILGILIVIIFAIWEFIILVIGLAKLHQTSWPMALMIILIPVIILCIITVVLVFFALGLFGVFSSHSLAPPIVAGSCQVYRPNGPGTTSFINTEGVCNNELPQYAAQFNTTSKISLNVQRSSQNTVAFWLYWKGTPVNGPSTVFSLGNGSVIGFSGSCFVFGNLGINNAKFKNTWISVIATSSNYGNQNLYINGVQQQNDCSASAIPSSATSAYLGNNGNSDGFDGLIADVQLYNTSIQTENITTLYTEGIGADPLNNLTYLVGWWPLNGNANDYSGNLNNGVSTSVVFTSGWTSGYNSP
jgi:hypothetical protein